MKQRTTGAQIIAGVMLPILLLIQANALTEGKRYKMTSTLKTEYNVYNVILFNKPRGPMLIEASAALVGKIDDSLNSFAAYQVAPGTDIGKGKIFTLTATGYNKSVPEGIFHLTLNPMATVFFNNQQSMYQNPCGEKSTRSFSHASVRQFNRVKYNTSGMQG